MGSWSLQLGPFNSLQFTGGSWAWLASAVAFDVMGVRMKFVLWFLPEAPRVPLDISLMVAEITRGWPGLVLTTAGSLFLRLGFPNCSEAPPNTPRCVCWRSEQRAAEEGLGWSPSCTTLRTVCTHGSLWSSLSQLDGRHWFPRLAAPERWL